MKPVYVISLLIVTACFFSSVKGQGSKNFQAGIVLGTTNYKGDLDDNFALKFTKPGLGGYLAYKFHPNLRVQAHLNQGWMGASDEKAAEDVPRTRRNLSFTSPLTELALTLRYDFFGNSRQYKYRTGFSPYLYGGVAVFRFNPKAEIDGQTYNLQPLGTEGQFLDDPNGIYADPYKRVQISLPMGLGIRVKLNEKLDLNLEMGARKTFTDYLDDVSGNYPDLGALAAQDPIAAQLSDRIDPVEYPRGAAYYNGIRGDQNKADWYIISSVSLTRSFGGAINPKFRSPFQKD